MYFSGIPFQGVVRHLIIINVLMFVGSYVVLGEEVFDSASMDYMSLGRLHLAAFLPGSSGGSFRPQVLTPPPGMGLLLVHPVLYLVFLWLSP